MKAPRISEAMGNIPEDLVNGAITYRRTSKKKSFIKWGSMAACLCLVICAIVIVPMLREDAPGITTPTGDYDRYKGFTILTGEYGIVWPWEYKTIYEKFNSINVDGVEFSGRNREVSASFIGEKIGNYQATGYDSTTDEIHYENFDVYEIKDVESSRLIAVKMEGKYYSFISKKYNPPTTLGGLLEEYSFHKYVELSRFSILEDGKEKTYHLLSDDDFIWNILINAKNTEAVNPIGFHENRGNYISFTVTSDALGIYKNAMYITESGYLWTNAYNREFLYFIGEDSAGKIIKHAKENSTVEKSEPYNNTIAGKIVEITDEYILVDDSILCKNPADGLTYKVILNDIKVSRYVELGAVRVGSTVVVAYEGNINVTNGNTIDKTIDISEGIISEGDVLIPE